MSDQAGADHVREAAKEAATVQAIELAAACIMVVIGIFFQVAQRKASEPDFTRSWEMRWAKQAERGWARMAGWSWRRAERFRVEYETLAGQSC